MVQPMLARMILPFFGGSPAVWNTSLFFFQTVLLLGYLYAHFAGRWLGIKRHMIVHIALIAAALYFLPVTIPAGLLARPDLSPVHQVLLVLLMSVGFPFFVLSANAPLLQKWFSATNHAAAHDPYFSLRREQCGQLPRAARLSVLVGAAAEPKRAGLVLALRLCRVFRRRAALRLNSAQGGHDARGFIRGA